MYLVLYGLLGSMRKRRFFWNLTLVTFSASLRRLLLYILIRSQSLAWFAKFRLVHKKAPPTGLFYVPGPSVAVLYQAKM
jgi:hypothetical protein